jgi:hypothetical protein
VSQICALTVFPSTLMLLVANSTPIVDLDSRLNSLRVKRERTGFGQLGQVVYDMCGGGKWLEGELLECLRAQV